MMITTTHNEATHFDSLARANAWADMLSAKLGTETHIRCMCPHTPTCEHGRGVVVYVTNPDGSICYLDTEGKL